MLEWNGYKTCVHIQEKNERNLGNKNNWLLRVMVNGSFTVHSFLWFLFKTYVRYSTAHELVSNIMEGVGKCIPHPKVGGGGRVI